MLRLRGAPRSVAGRDATPRNDLVSSFNTPSTSTVLRTRRDGVVPRRLSTRSTKCRPEGRRYEGKEIPAISRPLLQRAIAGKRAAKERLTKSRGKGAIYCAGATAAADVCRTRPTGGAPCGACLAEDKLAMRGSAITELKGGDEAYLRDVSRRVDRLVL